MRFERFEGFIDRAVPWLVIALIPFIVLSFFVDHTNPYYRLISWFDWFVIGVIALDLALKARHASSAPGFFKAHWFAIVSLLPVFLVVRVFEEFALIVDAVQAIQDAGSEAGAIGREARAASRSRLNVFARIARPLARSPRLMRAAQFFRHPRDRS